MYSLYYWLSENYNTRQSVSWTDWSKPESFDQVCGNVDVIQNIKEWINNFPYENPGGLLILGDRGIGKTLAVDIVCKNIGLSLISISPSEKRSKTEIFSLINATIDSNVIDSNDKNLSFSKEICILFEDVDIIFEEDHNFISGIINLIKRSKIPILMTSLSFSSKLASLQKNVKIINFFTSRLESNVFVQAVAALDGIPIPDFLLHRLLHYFGYDLRKCLINLELWSKTSPKTDRNIIFDRLLSLNWTCEIFYLLENILGFNSISNNQENKSLWNMMMHCDGGCPISFEEDAVQFSMLSDIYGLDIIYQNYLLLYKYYEGSTDACQAQNIADIADWYSLHDTYQSEDYEFYSDRHIYDEHMAHLNMESHYCFTKKQFPDKLFKRDIHYHPFNHSGYGRFNDKKKVINRLSNNIVESVKIPIRNKLIKSEWHQDILPQLHFMCKKQLNKRRKKKKIRIGISGVTKYAKQIVNEYSFPVF
eukprot:TRINITY_DN4331_c0_g1_i1.p1 TRINITY_DN4331_c0_g1~~TRINITY_DN4331_c0_g1_i1.p1  ORF type:complete len:478 (-),score=71.36 TRINITY_DN4331_c0_g1_i1:51-1484(-)